MTWRSFRSSPTPAQVGHGCDGIRPRPRHCGHGRLTEKPPCPNEMVPRPPHSGQVDQVAPGAPPEPVQVGHVSVTASETGTLPPSTATRNGISTTVSSVSLTGSSRRPRPKMDEKMSPRPPKSPKSIPSSAGASRSAHPLERSTPRYEHHVGRRRTRRTGACDRTGSASPISDRTRVRLGNFLEAFRGFRIVRDWRRGDTAWRAGGTPS